MRSKARLGFHEDEVTSGHEVKSEAGPQVFFADDKMAEQSQTLMKTCKSYLHTSTSVHLIKKIKNKKWVGWGWGVVFNSSTKTKYPHLLGERKRVVNLVK